MFANMSPEDRAAQIRAEAVSQETMQYEKPLSQEETDSLHSEQRILALRLYRLEKTKKRYLEEHNAEKKPVELKYKEVLKSMDTQTMSVEGDVYKVPEHAENMMYFIDLEGNIIQARPMTQDERQLNMLSSNDHLKLASNG